MSAGIGGCVHIIVSVAYDIRPRVEFDKTVSVSEPYVWWRPEADIRTLERSLWKVTDLE